ncbi:MAG: DUF2157 domain-containing protein [Pseudomonadota bacterium]
MPRYETRLKRDLANWTEKGWVTPEGAEAVLKAVASRERRFSIANIVAILGAVLLCFSVMTFVSANWEDLSKGSRLAILFTALWASYGAVYYAKLRGHPWICEAALLVSVGLFGGSIMLISQTYHLDGNAADAVLLWALGALTTGALAASRSALAAAFCLFALWAGWDVFQYTQPPPWMFLPAWGLTMVVVWWKNWTPGFHIALLSLISWPIFMAYYLAAQHDYPPGQLAVLLAQFGFLIAAAAFSSMKPESRLSGFQNPMAAYGIAMALLAIFANQMITGPIKTGFDLAIGPLVWAHMVLVLSVAGLVAWSVHVRTLKASDAGILLAASALPIFLSGNGFPSRALLAGVMIGLIVWTISFGLRHAKPSLKILGYCAFGVELLHIYFRTLGSLMDTAVLYSFAGLFVKALSIGFSKLQRHQPHHQGG